MTKSNSAFWPLAGAYCLAKVQTNQVGRKTLLGDASYLLDSYLQENLRTPRAKGLIPRGKHLTTLYFIVNLNPRCICDNSFIHGV